MYLNNIIEKDKINIIRNDIKSYEKNITEIKHEIFQLEESNCYLKVNKNYNKNI